MYLAAEPNPGVWSIMHRSLSMVFGIPIIRPCLRLSACSVHKPCPADSRTLRVWNTARYVIRKAITICKENNYISNRHLKVLQFIVNSVIENFYDIFTYSATSLAHCEIEPQQEKFYDLQQI